ncbi:MAG: tRNA (adenosine(37)-N6)-dimethylallyltransferase MiaA [Pseudomonadota bacterium]
MSCKPPILIAGPTASGKTALALSLARALDAVVINADSQQIYAAWRLLSARPSAEEMAGVPHRLFGHVALEAAYSVGAWLDEAGSVLARLRAEGRQAIVVGGTGLYFKALTQGLAPIPPVTPEQRTEAEALLEHIGPVALAKRLQERDPATAAGLDLANPRRVLRAWEVLAATGQGLAAWQAATPAPVLAEQDAITLALTPAREALFACCNARFERMVAQGVMEEVRAVAALDLPPSAPGLKALGAPELMACMAGRLSEAEAIAEASAATRRYAKRQLTWLRNQMGGWARLGFGESEESVAEALARVASHRS